MLEFLEACLSGPTLPATVMLLASCTYWLFVIIGAFDVELFDIDLDFDGNAEAFTGIGFVMLKRLNLGEVPLMLWMSIFSLGMWVLSMSLDHSPLPETTWEEIQALARNAGISLVLTKFATNPLRGIFRSPEPNPAAKLIGKQCEITTNEVTETTGQAVFATEAAPLLLNVRTHDGSLAKGEQATIVDFDVDNHIYFVKRTEQA